MAFGGNRPLLLWGHGPKHGLQWQHRPRPHYSLRWPHWFLTTLVTPVLPLFIVPTPFCFFFSSISPTLTTAPLCCAQGPMSVWDHFRRAMPHTCIMAPSSSQLGHAPVPWLAQLWTGSPLRLAPCLGSMAQVWWPPWACSSPRTASILEESSILGLFLPGACGSNRGSFSL